MLLALILGSCKKQDSQPIHDKELSTYNIIILD